MNTQIMKSLRLKKNPDDRGETLECSICDNAVSFFVIMKNGDIECSYCGDKKANLAQTKTNSQTGKHEK